MRVGLLIISNYHAVWCGIVREAEQTMKITRKSIMIIAGGILAGICFIALDSGAVLRLLFFITGIAAAVVLVPYLPVWFPKLAVFAQGGTASVSDARDPVSKRKLEAVAVSLGKLADSVQQETVRRKDEDSTKISKMFDEVSSRLCKECIGCSFCWGEHFEETYGEVCVIMDTSRKNGSISEDELPEHFTTRCVCVREYVEEINKYLSEDRRQQFLNDRITENRNAAADQINEVAKAVYRVAGNIYKQDETVEIRKRLLAAHMRAEHVRIRDIVLFSRQNKGLELHFAAKCRSGQCMTSKDAAQILSDILGCRMVPKESARHVIGNEYKHYIFCEDVNYHILTGVAGTACTDDVSGDNYSFLRLSRSDMAMILSDGMGSGAEAGRGSEMVVELLEQLLEAGFDETSAVKMINSVLLLKSDQTDFATADLCVINLYSGSCEFIKAGAATTFIKRKDWIETITSTAMPLGMVNRADYDEKRKKLYNGDYVIMISDGVLDSLNTGTPAEREEYMLQFLSKLNEKSPQEIANRILEMVKQHSNNGLIDDVTILVSGVWQKN